MAKKTYILTLKFDKEVTKEAPEELYKGDSYYRTNLQDQLLITENMIQLTCERSTKKDMNTILSSSKSPERFHIHRALSCYYAVTGELPELMELSLQVGNDKEYADAKAFSQAWPKEKLYITMDKAVIGKCVSGPCKGSNKNMPYVVLSYFLKAQNDSFSNDCFRAAWSGFNAFYGNLLQTRARECDKIDELRKIIQDDKSKLTESLKFVKALDDDSFWKTLNWYVFVTESGWLREKVFPTPKKKQSVMPKSIYEDTILLKYFTKYLIALDEGKVAELVKKGQIEEKEAEKRLKTIEQNKQRTNDMLETQKENLRQQIEFLSCDYCYKKRNRNYHGAVAFPIFSSSNGNHGSLEMRLVAFLLFLIKDLLEEYETAV